MANLHGEGTAIRVVAHPLLLKWNWMKWEPKRAMNNQPDEASGSKESLGFSRGECQSRIIHWVVGLFETFPLKVKKIRKKRRRR